VSHRDSLGNRSRPDRAAAAILLVATLPSCASAKQALAPPAMSVAQLIDQFAQLDGQALDVHGWMGSCTRTSCGLFATRPEASKGVITGWAHVLKPTDSFLAELRSQNPRRVVLSARVVVTCRADQGEICLERIGYLVPLSARPLSH
jgi:hypothetical protein